MKLYGLLCALLLVNVARADETTATAQYKIECRMGKGALAVAGAFNNETTLASPTVVMLLNQEFTIMVGGTVPIKLKDDSEVIGWHVLGKVTRSPEDESIAHVSVTHSELVNETTDSIEVRAQSIRSRGTVYPTTTKRLDIGKNSAGEMLWVELKISPFDDE